MSATTNFLRQFGDLAVSFDGNAFLSGGMLQRLTLAVEGNLSLVWAPFEHICESARVVIVGICPGRTQAENGLHAFRAAIREGMPIEVALRRAKLTASFSGAMRTNFIDMLDHIGLNQALQLESCGQLFNAESEYAHFTSALRYPVFISGENYAGNPDMLQTPLLRQLIDTALVEEARVLRRAAWISMGPKPAGALNYLAAKGILRQDQILTGVPHPSGANAERIAYFLGRKERKNLSRKTNPVAIDKAREALKLTVAGFAERGI